MCLPDLDHNWPRYVLPAGATLSLSDGFLPDPDGRYDQYSNPGLLSLTEFFNRRCCILLGVVVWGAGFMGNRKDFHSGQSPISRRVRSKRRPTILPDRKSTRLNSSHANI